MRERAIQFGESTSLVGVLSEPADPAGPETPAVLLLNSGILHRVGSCRFHVKLARRLAEAGYLALRFDFSGIGDSRPRKDALPFEESSVLEIGEAMDYLTARRGVETFVLGGLCSGADAAYFAACRDSRVVGIFQLDAFAYRTPRYYWTHYAPRLIRPDVWGRLAQRLARRLRRAASPKPSAGSDAGREMPTYLREFPPKEQVRRHLEQLARRGVRQYYWYSGGFADYYNYADQIRDTYRGVDFGETLHVEFVPGSDHIVTDPRHQDRLVSTLDEWMRRHWPVERMAGAATGS